jgi:hypothetical protein
MKNTSEYGKGGPVVAGDGKRVPEKWTRAREVAARETSYGDGKGTVVLAGGLRGGIWWRTVVGRIETRPTGYIAQLEDEVC